MNPYASPPIAAFETPEADVRQKLKAPGVALAVLAIVSMPLSALTILSGIAGLPRAADLDSELIGRLVGMFLPLICNIVVLLGAIEILRLRNYRSALTAAILACIPICSPCVLIGIPFGIWAIVVLRQPGTIAAFQATKETSLPEV
jgi:hypothetical protein